MAGESDNHLVKVILFGKEKSGKSNLCNAFTGKWKYDKSYISTIGVDFDATTIDSIKYLCWDASGNKRFRAVVSNYFRSVQLAVFAIDPLDVEDSIAEWKNYKTFISENVKVIVAITKNDTGEAQAFTDDDLKEKLENAGIEYNELVRCSSKDSDVAAFTAALQRQVKIQLELETAAPASLYSAPQPVQAVPTVDIGNLRNKLELLPDNEVRYSGPKDAAERFSNYVIDFRTAALKELGKLEELESKGKLSKKHNKRLTLLSEATTTVSSLHESVSSQAQVTDKKDIKISDIKQCNKLASRFKGSKMAGILLGLAGLAITIAGITVSAMAGAGFFPSMTLAAPIGAGGLGIVAAGVATLTVVGTHLFFGRNTPLSKAMKGVANEAKKVEKQFRV